MGQVVRVVQPAKNEIELEQEAARTRVQAAEASAEAAQLERGTFLLRRYSTVEDIEAARGRSLRELEIHIVILNSQRSALSEQLATHEASLAGTLAVGDPADHYKEETIAALRAELESLDEAAAGTSSVCSPQSSLCALYGAIRGAGRHRGIAPAIERTGHQGLTSLSQSVVRFGVM